ncbi:MAG: hypothetical protein ACRECN_00500, partial [Methylocella sp.]
MSRIAAGGRHAKSLQTDLSRFIDCSRNGGSGTAAAEYATRALQRRSVSTPLVRGELSDSLPSGHLTAGNLCHRREFLKRDPWQGFFKIRHRIPVDPRSHPDGTRVAFWRGDDCANPRRCDT